MDLPNKPGMPQYEDEYLMFGMMFILGNKLQVIGDNFYEEITSKQWLILVMLGIFDEKYPTLNELSDAMGSSHQNVKQLVLKLQNKGYLELQTDEKDRRKTRIRRTPKCVELALKYNEKEQEFMKLLFNGMEKTDLNIALKILIQFEKNLEEIRNGNSDSL